MKQMPNASFFHKPFDLNRNGKLDPAEAALMMMVFDDVESPADEEPTKDASFCAPRTTYTTINIDDMDIEGI